MKTPDYVVTYNETPHYLTTGKRYRILEDFEDGALFGIPADDSDPVLIRVPSCAHLKGHSWKKGYVVHV